VPPFQSTSHCSVEKADKNRLICTGRIVKVTVPTKKRLPRPTPATPEDCHRNDLHTIGYQAQALLPPSPMLVLTAAGRPTQ
jgi:hypothetical protein